jgi:hypothetical protein
MPDYLEPLTDNELAAAARQVTDEDAKTVLAWMEKQKANLAEVGMSQIDSEMSIRYQGAFGLLRELIDKLKSARKLWQDKKVIEDEKKARNL